MAPVERNHQMAPVVLPPQIWRPSLLFLARTSFLVLLASLLFHRCVMPRAHDDCKFCDEWLVQDKYKEWVVKDGDPRLARCQFCMKSSKTKLKFRHPWTMAMHCKQCQLPNEFSALGQLVYLRKSESMSGHVPVLFMCCEYHFLDGPIMNFLFLINSYSKNPTSSVSAADKGHFLVVTPPHLRTSYNLFFLEYGCIASWKRMVVSLSSLLVVLKIAFVCVLTSNSGVHFARYDFPNISGNIDSTCMHLISKCA